MNSLEEVLKQAAEYEKNNEWDLASRYYFRALNIFPNNKDVLLNLGMCLHNKGDDEEALSILVECYKLPAQPVETKETVLQFIMKTFYEPNAQRLKMNYENNYRQLQTYEFNYISDLPTFDSMLYYFIPASEKKIHIFEKKTQSFLKVITLDKTAISDDINSECVVAVDIFDPKMLNDMLQHTFNKERNYPVYLIWEDKILNYAYLQLYDYCSLILNSRIAFFDSYETDSVYYNFLKDHQTYLPRKILGDINHHSRLDKLVIDVFNYRTQDISDKSKEVEEYYSRCDLKYLQDLFNNPSRMRILFYTSMFTDVVQYCARDFMNACMNLGISCELLIEKSSINCLENRALVTKIAEVKPDLVFCINFCRADFNIQPENLIFVSWMQDPAIQLTSKEHAQKFGPYDYILSHAKLFIDQLTETGFPRERILYLTIPADETIFYPRECAGSEKEYLSADVAVCGNFNTNPEEILNDLIGRLVPAQNEPIIQERLTHLLSELYDMLKSMVQNDELILNAEQCKNIIDSLAKKYSLSGSFSNLHDEVFFRLAYGLHRKDTVQALCNAGVKLKLWGKHWEQVPEFMPFCMGWVKHGNELAKVYSSSRIIIGTFSHYTLHARIWEAIACGALCMLRFIPTEFNMGDIRDYLSEGDGFVFYHNKKDLIDKIDYYLHHEDERIRLVKQGQSKVLEKLTYQAAVKNWLSFVKNDLNQEKIVAGE